MIPVSRLRLILSIALAFSLITFLTIDLFGQPIRSRASGSSIIVNSNGDSGTCSGGTITLRCAIATANANAASATTITFSIANQTITVGSTLAFTNTSQPITVDGTGQGITIDGGGTVQIFTVASSSTIALTGLTVSHGYANNTLGGALENNGALTINASTFSNNIVQSSFGGAIDNNGGTLTINSSTFSGNSADSGDEFGGAVDNYYGGTMTISYSTFYSNSAANGNGGAVGNLATMTINSSTFYNNSAYVGGAINNSGTLTVSNSTLSGNTVGTSGLGGGIAEENGTLTISNSTISGNSANTGGGISNGISTAINLLSTIVAGNTLLNSGSGTDVNGAFSSLGHNLIGDGSTSTGLTNGVNHDQVGTSGTPINPLLGALAANGGSTQTMALQTGSPAISAGVCTGNLIASPTAPAVLVDQRGDGRKSPCDVGAYESSATSTPTFTPTKTATPTNTPTATSTFTPTSTATSTNTPSKTATFTPTATNTPIPAKIDSIGIFRAGTFYLRLHNSTGNADLTVGFTAGTKPYPIVGDWTGAGFDTVGVFDQNNGQFTLCTANLTASCASVANQKSLVLGIPNDQPLSGRWLLSATNAGVGVFRPSNGLIYLKTALTTGYADYTMVLGIPGDTGLAGDWNGKGFDSPGVYRPSNSTFYLSNVVTNGSVIGNYQLQYGIGGDAPVVGDWIAQGHDGVGLFRQSNGFTYLKNLLTTGYADYSFTYGIAGDVPVAGHWQAVYPPIAPIAPPASILIAKTAVPQPWSISVPGGDQIGG